jgi:hypothetical protein
LQISRDDEIAPRAHGELGSKDRRSRCASVGFPCFFLSLPLNDLNRLMGKIASERVSISGDSAHIVDTEPAREKCARPALAVMRSLARELHPPALAHFTFVPTSGRHSDARCFGSSTALPPRECTDSTFCL